MPISQNIYKSTVRIESDTPDGGSVGTGFWFLFPIHENSIVPLLVTNKHVVRNAKQTRIRLNVSSESDSSLRFFDVNIEQGESAFLMHPDASVDICVFVAAPLFSQMEAQGINPNLFFFSERNLRSDQFITPIEEVHMTGYPNGLWDMVNNRPITRRGITASSVLEDWQGRPEFLIDMACFGGSSGSPVYILNSGMYQVEDGIAAGERFILLGLLYAGPTVNVNGNIEIINVPTATSAVVKTTLGMNLGMVIKAEKLIDFKPLLGL
ncbi:trypsin-like peptidase domain-containing protein [Salmonella enterica]|nr:trypsin-like peptidase domain-containing protein [Salmonella enterica]